MTVLRRRDESVRQAIVVMIGAILLAVALVATIVDGGNVFAQQRVTQNGVDAAAEAGAVLLAERLAGADAPSGGWDVNIGARIHQVAEANNITSTRRTTRTSAASRCGPTGRAPSTRTPGSRTSTRPSRLATARTSCRAVPRRRRTARTASSGRSPGVLVIGEKEGRAVRRRRDRDQLVPGPHPRDGGRGLPPELLRRERGQLLRPAAGCVPDVDHPVRREQQADRHRRPLGLRGRLQDPLCHSAPATSAGSTGIRRPAAPARSSARSSPPTTRRSTCPPGSTSPRPATPTAAAAVLCRSRRPSGTTRARPSWRRSSISPAIPRKTASQTAISRPSSPPNYGCPAGDLGATARTSGTGCRASPSSSCARRR